MGVVLPFYEGFRGLEEARESGVGELPRWVSEGSLLSVLAWSLMLMQGTSFDGVEGVYSMRCWRQATNHTKRNWPYLQAQGIFPV